MFVPLEYNKKATLCWQLTVKKQGIPKWYLRFELFICGKYKTGVIYVELSLEPIILAITFVWMIYCGYYYQQHILTDLEF